MQEKVDLKERVEDLEHRCIQLSGETDTIGERAGQPPRRGELREGSQSLSVSRSAPQESTLPSTRIRGPC